MVQKQSDYIPALRYEWLTGLYDPILQWTMREGAFKRDLVRQSRIKNGHRVLDLGSGTATLTLLIKQTYPNADVVGVDGDQQVLEIARAKVAECALDITLDEGNAFDLSYPDQSFDRVLSSLLFHHLTRENKELALAEAFRVLRPGGEIHIADWGQARNRLMRGALFLVQMLDGFETTSDNAKGMLPILLEKAGFAEVQQSAQYSTIFGTLALYQARKTV